MDLALADRHALVVGGSRGIGRAVVAAFAAEGARVSVCARSPVEGVTIAADIATVDGVAAAVDAALADHGPIDAVVALATANGMADTEEEYRAAFETDLMQGVRLLRQVKDAQPRHPFALCCFSSTHGLSGHTPHHAYSVMKAALVAWVKNSAIAEAPHGIRVNAVAPGAIDTPDGYWGEVRRDDPATYEEMRRAIPAGRLGTPEEVANAVVFLCSKPASWITGATLLVDGGESPGIR